MNRITRLVTVAILMIALGLTSCNVYEEPIPERDGLYYPIGVDIHPDGRFLYVVNSNFDLLYRDDQGGTVSVIDTEAIGDDDQEAILAESSPFLPSFGAQIQLNDDATKAYVTSRHSNEITVLSVAEQGQALYCEVDSEAQSDSRPCSTGRIPDAGDGARIPTDPFGLAVGRVERVIDGELHSFDTVHMAHLIGRDVTSATFPDGELAGASLRSAQLIEGGGTQVEIRPGTEEVYVAGRSGRRIDGYSPFINESGEVEAIVRGMSIWLTERDGNVDARGLAFDDDGDRMYVATRNPSKLDIVAMDGVDGPRVVHSMPLQRQPSQIEAHTGADGIFRLYIPSYDQGTIEVVEPDQEAVVDTIDVGRSPYVMTTDPSPAHCVEPGQRCQGYVTLFDAAGDGSQQCENEDRYCGQLAVIDLDPDSETFHTVIETIE